MSEQPKTDPIPTPLDVCRKLLDTWKRAGPLGSHQMEKFETVVRMAEMVVDDADQKAREFLALIPDPIIEHHPQVNCRCLIASKYVPAVMTDRQLPDPALVRAARKAVVIIESLQAKFGIACIEATGMSQSAYCQAMKELREAIADSVE